MEVHGFTILNILTVSLPVIVFLLLCWASSTTTTTPSPTGFSASQVLRAHGYSLFANALVSASSTNVNFSGTILAPPDFAFSFATAKFSSKSFIHGPPRPSTALLRYHTLQIPSLNWLNLTSRPDGDELQTHYNNNYCLFLFKNANGDAALSSSKKPIHAVTIRRPDLFIDDTLTIHGVDGVLDPTAAKKCSVNSKISPTAGIQSPMCRSSIDHAIRVLRTRGFHVVATAMTLRRSDLLTVKEVTIFAPSDTALFSVPHGFRYNFRHHIVPKRLHSIETLTFTDGMEIETLAPNKTVFIRSGEGDIRVNGVPVDGGELYHNQWIVVYPISISLDDAVHEEIVDVIPTAAPVSTNELIGGPSPSQERDISSEENDRHQRYITGDSVDPPSLSPEKHVPVKAGLEVPQSASKSGIEPSGPPSLSPEIQNPEELARSAPEFSPVSGETHIPDMTSKSMGPPFSATDTSEATDRRCRTGGSNDVAMEFTKEIEGEDLFCPVNNVQDL